MGRMSWLSLLAALAGTPAMASPIPIVAAENFYGDVARQIGGPDVTVGSILSNPDQDPHLFEASPSVGRAVSRARIIIYSGIDYDPWMAKILGAGRNAGRKTIVVADLAGRKPGDNPHVWYDTATMATLAKTLCAMLVAEDPGHATAYQGRLVAFTKSLAPIDAQIAALRARLAGTKVTATEPIFGYMFEALGLDVRNTSFQTAVMNNTEPSAADVAAFEHDLSSHQVQLLIYNSQASDKVADHMRDLAQKAHVAVVGAAETEPSGKNYQAWMSGELAAVDAALPASAAPLSR